MSITTKQKALEKIFESINTDSENHTLEFVLSGFGGALKITEDQIKEELKKAYSDVTDWGF